MSVDYTTTALIANLKRRASIPASQALFNEATMLEFLSDEMLSLLVPQVMSVREKYFETFTDYTLVSGTDTYIVPRRAIGGKVANFTFVDANGEELPCERLSTKDVEYTSTLDGGHLSGALIRGNHIHMLPDAATFVPLSLRVYYYRRPNRLVKESQAGKVTAIVGSVVTLNNTPTSWTTSTTFDAIKGSPGFETLADDSTINTLSGNDLTFDTVPTGLAVGDWIAESGESPVPQIPYELHATLAQMGATKVLEALGDQAGLQAGQAKQQIQEKNALTLLTPRVEDKPKKLVSRKGLWRQGGSLWRR